MASSTQRASTSIPFASLWKYDAFLSFRGKETRKTFTDHLHKALAGKRIKVFKDDKLERGTTISSELLTAIAESRFAIIVISQDYASSKWCLDELVKIFECMKDWKTIIPIFYDVDPSDVRNQRGTFKDAFNKHEKDGIHDTEKLRGWKKALTTVGGLSGWIWGQYRYETKFIEEIVESLYNKLMCAGCNRRVEDGLNCLDALWHRPCLLCKGCNRPFTDLQFWECGDQPYHESCYELQCHVCNVCKKSIQDNSDGQVEYMEHPFWRQRYCPSHVKDGTPGCCSCERLKPRDITYYKLDDGRKLCPECKESIINTDNGRRSICLEVRKFYKKLNLKVEKIPVQLVSRQDIIDVLKEGNDGSDCQLPVLRAVCLCEERTVTSAIWGRPTQLFCEVKEILIWYGLPRILTGSLLAQQMMSAWLRLNRCPNLSPEVEKGICRYFANRWLDYSSNSDSSINCSEFEKKLCKFRKRKIESDCEALLTAKEAVRKHGLGTTLETIRKTGKFPSVTH
ncbi:protein DA1-related 1-like isoform X1 [Rosa rugosa]|uniref:protein DA1-related 1-like isoform X1 n=1 Tax=Rosa rugosa TaxID=74645 RepID=UPI002B40C331|nr:protein DA1-related 1-like isoform X1 [Rosa rugosa]